MELDGSVGCGKNAEMVQGDIDSLLNGEENWNTMLKGPTE